MPYDTERPKEKNKAKVKTDGKKTKQEKIKCPNCGSEKIYKRGISKSGHQRFCCRNEACKTGTFQLEYQYKACYPDIDEKILSMAANAKGIRHTSRVLGISTTKVMSTLKKGVAD